jgi:hypothetical protein
MLSPLEENWTLQWLEQQSQRRPCDHEAQKKVVEDFQNKLHKTLWHLRMTEVSDKH